MRLSVPLAAGRFSHYWGLSKAAPALAWSQRAADDHEVTGDSSTPVTRMEWFSFVPRVARILLRSRPAA